MANKAASERQLLFYIVTDEATGDEFMVQARGGRAAVDTIAPIFTVRRAGAKDLAAWVSARKAIKYAPAEEGQNTDIEAVVAGAGGSPPGEASGELPSLAYSHDVATTDEATTDVAKAVMSEHSYPHDGNGSPVEDGPELAEMPVGIEQSRFYSRPQIEGKTETPIEAISAEDLPF